MAKSYTRLDRLLAERGLVPSRERAQALILAGKVLVAGRVVTKAGSQVDPDAPVELIEDDLPYVSRGGFKLEAALDAFEIDPAGWVALDVGASTGGFTDCLLQRGATRVYAVDVGYGQLAWKLRQDLRVVAIERQNIRYLSRDSIPEPVRIVVMDTSFISLRLVIPPSLAFLEKGGRLVSLIKPQFEAGRDRVGKGGVVRDPEVHREVCESIIEFCGTVGLSVQGVVPSPILGPKGNREFLLAATLG